MRIEFKGKGEPIPSIGLPDPQVSDELPPQMFVYEADGVFSVADWIGFGYTNFEVWCIGAAGGRGGGVQREVTAGGGTINPSYSYGISNAISFGGEGGGGGLHRVTGLLEDLPSSVPIVVGQPGTDGLDGNPHYRWRLATSSGYAVVKYMPNQPGMTDGAGNAIPPYFYSPDSPYLFFSPEPFYIAPQDGGDGGASIFAGVAQASGGKGGKKSPVYRDHREDMFQYGVVGRISLAHERGPGGDGGQGGVGGQSTAGGGALGGLASDILGWYESAPPGGYPEGYYILSEKPRIFTPPQDGTWDGTIGKGGGGGRGGTILTYWYDNRFPPDQQVLPTINTASSGGRGSFSYGDTSVYGNQGPVGVIANGTARIIPGTAGGAKAPGNRKFGSRSFGFSPKGLVLIRIFKL